jgi:hypothetical protein
MGKDKPFIEKSCTIKHRGKSYTSGGSFVANCSDGYARGVVYVDPKENRVTTWHGKKIATASLGRTFQGNFCKMRSVSFEFAGAKFTGRYCPDWADAVKVRSTTKVKV